MKMIVSPSGSHCRSFFTPPSVVREISSEPSTFITQTSLLATKAILSAPPNAGTDGVSVSVSVGGSEVAVLVDSMITMGMAVASASEVDVSVIEGAEVAVLTGVSVSSGVLVPLKRKKPPANAIMATTGTITKSPLNAFFWGMVCTLAFIVGVTFLTSLATVGNLVTALRPTSRRALIISTAVEKRSFLFFAMAFWMIVSIPSGSFGLVWRMCGTGSVMCLMATAMGVSASKGCFPVSISKRMIP